MKKMKTRGDENISDGLHCMPRKAYQPSEGVRRPKHMMQGNRKKMMDKKMLWLFLALTFASAAFAATPAGYKIKHYDYGYGACVTWTNDTENGTIKGKWTEATSWIRAQEFWSSDYSERLGVAIMISPADCQYKGDNPPSVKIPFADQPDGTHMFEYVVKGNLCQPKTVKPYVCQGGMNDGKFCQQGQAARDCPGGGMCVPGTKIVTDYPWAWAAGEFYHYVRISDGNPWITDSYPSGCVWKPYIYGAPPA